MHYGHFSLIFNGEIYNHLEIRKSLDFPFQTRSDTETLLALLILKGPHALPRLDGMFAFAFLDKQNQTLLLGRDRVGKKPLYYYHSHETFLFASELNALKNALPLTPDTSHIASYLRTGFFYGEATAYENVKSLPAGHTLHLELNTLKQTITPWFSLESLYQSPLNIDDQEALELTEEALLKGVQSRMLSSDLEVGCFLSGGIDSGLITALAAQSVPNLKTFTVAFDGAYDESPLAQSVAAHYKTDHHTLRLTPRIQEDVEQILLGYGQPFFDSSAIPSWYVSKAAKAHVTVVLNGDGADELFGGYRRYVPVANGWLNIAKQLRFLLPLLPKAHEKKSLYNFFYRLLFTASQKDPISRYNTLTIDSFEGFTEFLKQGDERTMLKDLTHIESLAISPLSKALLADASALLTSDLLIKMDIATMAHSLEGRSPFLSKWILELAPRLPDRTKIHGTTTKALLRTLAKKHLPEVITNQPKRGFEIPLKTWIDGALKEMVHDALSHGCYSEHYTSRDFIDRLLKGDLIVSKEKRAKMLWTLFSLEVWHRNLNR